MAKTVIVPMNASWLPGVDWHVTLERVGEEVHVVWERSDGGGERTEDRVMPRRLAVLRRFDPLKARQPVPAGVVTERDRFEFGQACAVQLIKDTGRGRGGWYKLTDVGAAVLEVADHG